MQQPRRRIRTAQPLLTLFAGAAATIAVLLVARSAITGPMPDGSPASWTGDDLAVLGMWWGALIGSAWLAVTTLACIAALGRGHTRTARRIARFAPPLARRMLQTALIGTCALVPTAAYAAAPSAPITVHVDANGRLSPNVAPIVRTPDTRPTTSTTSRAATIRRSTPTTTTAPVTAAPVPGPPPIVVPTQRVPSTPHALVPVELPTRAYVHVHVVVRGDNLWRIAQAAVMGNNGSTRPTAEEPTTEEIAGYWWRVIDANRTTLRSGDPNLIFPGEVVTLP